MARDGILLRSPYFVNLESANLTSLRIDLYVWTGNVTTDKPLNPNYTLTSSAFTNSNGLKYAEIDIAPYAGDYVDVVYNFSVASPSNAVWIDYDLYYTTTNSNKLILEGSYNLYGLDGYNYTYQGYNSLAPETTLLSGNYIELPEGEDTQIPVVNDNLSSYSLYAEATLSGGETPLETITPGLAVATESDDLVYYASTTTAFGTPRTVVLNYSGVLPDETIYLRYNDACRNPVTLVSFVNRYGVIQPVHFFGRTDVSMTTNKTMYKKNVLDGKGGYNIRSHQDDILTKNGKQSFKSSTGFYKEDSNYIFNELMLSEKVWIKTSRKILFSNTVETKDLTIPVTLTGSNISYKTHLNDKLINYDFNFDHAVDVVNNIR